MKRSTSSGYFTLWTASTPLLVFTASNMREARQVANSDEFLRFVRRATFIGRPLLEYTASVWVSLASEDERKRFESADFALTPFNDDLETVWLQKIDTP